MKLFFIVSKTNKKFHYRRKIQILKLANPRLKFSTSRYYFCVDLDCNYRTCERICTHVTLQLTPMIFRVTKIKESGLINKLKAEYWPRPSFCSTGMQTEAKAVSLRDVQGAYYVMAILLALATLALLSEKLFQFVRNSDVTISCWRRRKRMEHSGGYQDTMMSNGDVSDRFGIKYRYSDYFTDFSQAETHEMRSVRYQSSFIKNSDVNHATSNGLVISNGHATSNGHVSNGHVTSNGDAYHDSEFGLDRIGLGGNFWRYESVRNNNVYTYSDTAKTVL